MRQDYSVAARQLADHERAAEARVEAEVAVAWAVENKIALPPTGRLAVINAARVAAHLPPFVIIQSAERLAPRPGPTLPRKPNQQPIIVQPPIIVRRTPMPQPDTRSDLRTSAGLRDMLFDELEALRAGKSDPKRAMAVAKLAATIVDSVRMEIEFVRHVPPGKEPEQMPAPLRLVGS